MDTKQIAQEILNVARELSASRNRKGYGILKNPDKIVDKMWDKGIALNYDGSVWGYPITGLGIPDYSESPEKIANSMDKAVRKPKHIIDNNEEKIEDKEELLDDLTRFKRLMADLRPSDNSIDQLLTDYEKEIAPQLPKGTQKDELMIELTEIMRDMREYIEDGVFRDAIDELERAQELIDQELIPKWESQNEFFAEQRKMMQEISGMLNDNPAALPELATLGNPPDEDEIPPSGPTVELDGDMGVDRLEKEMKDLIDKDGIAEFTYQKGDGKVRDVRFNPKEMEQGKSGLKARGQDLDRQDERSYFLNRIQ